MTVLESHMISAFKHSPPPQVQSLNTAPNSKNVLVLNIRQSTLVHGMEIYMYIYHFLNSDLTVLRSDVMESFCSRQLFNLFFKNQNMI